MLDRFDIKRISMTLSRLESEIYCIRQFVKDNTPPKPIKKLKYCPLCAKKMLYDVTDDTKEFGCSNMRCKILSVKFMEE